MKNKRLLFISCLAAGALIASPSFAKPAKKSAGMPPKWSRLNKVAVLFEYAVDAEGNTHSEYWEWK